jgi:uncharacterized Fe-S center protein
MTITYIHKEYCTAMQGYKLYSNILKDLTNLLVTAELNNTIAHNKLVAIKLLLMLNRSPILPRIITNLLRLITFLNNLLLN